MASLSRTLRAGRPLHVLMAVGVGVSSGVFLFQSPLKVYWEERRVEAERARGGGLVQKKA